MEKRKFFFFGVLIGLVLLGAWVRSQPDGRLHLVFCDVGQGDAIYIKFPDGRDGLIDGGPGRAVLTCLGKHMAFWDRKIELVFLTHPQADHLNGLLEVLERYQVDLFLAPPVGNETKGYGQLVELVKEKGIRVRNVYSREQLKVKSQKLKVKKQDEGVIMNVLWPEREWLAGKLREEKYMPTGQAAAGQLSMYNVLGAKTWHSNLNDFSLVLEVSFGEFEALLTGDAEVEILERALMGDRGETRQIEILKIPHHGSAGAVSTALLEKLNPKLAVISVGENNRYGHPDEKEITKLSAFAKASADRRNEIRILRTDIEGEIEVVTDGEKFKVKSEKSKVRVEN